jgi:hypothetical protein
MAFLCSKQPNRIIMRTAAPNRKANLGASTPQKCDEFHQPRGKPEQQKLFFTTSTFPDNFTLWRLGTV